MKIIFKDYVMEPEDSRFNLLKKVIRKNKETGQKYDYFLMLGYGMSFEHCLNDIAHDMLEADEKEVSIPEWIEQYKAIKNELLIAIKS
ncbi:MAG: hypothetical protein PHU98_06385 [Mariniphaga sp.]|nr:hypothetical protein [Paludibacter sp.]MDD4225999.1 hypothetical protein [Mariniphaga sp.]